MCVLEQGSGRLCLLFTARERRAGGPRGGCRVSAEKAEVPGRGVGASLVSFYGPVEVTGLLLPRPQGHSPPHPLPASCKARLSPGAVGAVGGTAGDLSDSPVVGESLPGTLLLADSPAPPGLCHEGTERGTPGPAVSRAGGQLRGGRCQWRREPQNLESKAHPPACHPGRPTTPQIWKLVFRKLLCAESTPGLAWGADRPLSSLGGRGASPLPRLPPPASSGSARVTEHAGSHRSLACLLSFFLFGTRD